MFAEPGRAAALAALLVVALLTCALYLPGLGGPLLLDDFTVLEALLKAPRAELFTRAWLIDPSGPLGRPLSMFSFALNAAWAGDNIAAWKLVNVLLHAVTGAAVYAFAAALFEAVGRRPGAARFAALIVAAAWLFHPLQVSTVLYTVQRMTELSALLCVLGMLAYTRARLNMLAGADGRVLIALALLLMTGLAVLAKENGALLPLYCVALELTVFASAPRPAWLCRTLWACALLPLLGGVVYIAVDVQGHLLNAYLRRDFTLGERLLTEARVVLTYLRWLLVPRRTDLGFYHDDVVVSRGLGDDLATPAALCAIAGLLGAAWFWRRHAPLAAFGIALFFAGHALESSVFGLELSFEHRNYLPALGIIVLLVDTLLRTAPARLAPALALGMVLALFLACLTRTVLWGSAGPLYRAFVDAHPQSERARMTLAEWYVGRAEVDAALALFDGAAPRLAFDLERVRIDCLDGAADDAAAGAAFAAVGGTFPITNIAFDTLLHLASLALDGRCALPRTALMQALETARSLPSARTRHYRLYVYLAMLYHQGGDHHRAFKRLAAAALRAPQDPFVAYLRAEWLAGQGDLSAARVALAEARTRRGAAVYAALDRSIAALLSSASAAQSGAR